MIGYLRSFLPTVHKTASINDVVRWVASLGVPEVACGGRNSSKEMFSLTLGRHQCWCEM